MSLTTPDMIQRLQEARGTTAKRGARDAHSARGGPFPTIPYGEVDQDSWAVFSRRPSRAGFANDSREGKATLGGRLRQVA